MNIDEIRARVEATTPGPWWLEDLAIWVREREWFNGGIMQEAIIDCGYSDSPTREADAEFIVHAREDILLLLREYELMCAVVEAGRRAERKLWHEYRRDFDGVLDAPDEESWAEGEALADALADLDAAREET